jgi:hypothetical protein
MIRTLAVIAVTGAALAACESSPEAPYSPGVCYHVVPPAEGEEMRLNVVATDQPQIEFCAARLEEMRVRFLGMGGNQREIVGAYQGQFIFIDPRGVSFSKTLEGGRFLALARTGDGRLAIPGAIRRAIDGTPVAVAAPPPTPSPAG